MISEALSFVLVARNLTLTSFSVKVLWTPWNSPSPSCRRPWTYDMSNKPGRGPSPDSWSSPIYHTILTLFFQKIIESFSRKPSMMSIKRLSNILIVPHAKLIFILKLNWDIIGTMIKAVPHLLVPIVEVGFHLVKIIELWSRKIFENPFQKTSDIGMETKKMEIKNEHREWQK